MVLKIKWLFSNKSLQLVKINFAKKLIKIKNFKALLFKNKIDLGLLEDDIEMNYYHNLIFILFHFILIISITYSNNSSLVSLNKQDKNDDYNR